MRQGFQSRVACLVFCPMTVEGPRAADKLLPGRPQEAPLAHTSECLRECPQIRQNSNMFPGRSQNRKNTSQGTAKAQKMISRALKKAPKSPIRHKAGTLQRHKYSPWRGTHESPRRHPRGTQKADRRHPGGTMDAPRRQDRPSGHAAGPLVTDQIPSHETGPLVTKKYCFAYTKRPLKRTATGQPKPCRAKECPA